MLLDSILFYAFAALILFSALMTITRRNVVYSAVWLINALVGVAGLYLLQGAEFLSGVQVIVYIGGIMVLFLFVIMLVNLDDAARQRQFNRQRWLALACVIIVGAQILYVIRAGSDAFRLAPPAPETGGLGNVEQIADVLFSEYLLPFEIASLLLLVAVVGSVVMSKKRI